MAVLPCHSLCWFPFLSPTSKFNFLCLFIYFLKRILEQSTSLLSQGILWMVHSPYPKHRPVMLCLWTVDWYVDQQMSASLFFHHYIHLHIASIWKSHFLCYSKQTICCSMRVKGHGTLSVTFISNNLCNLKGRAGTAVQKFNYQLCCWSAGLPWASCCRVVFQFSTCKWANYATLCNT